MTKRKTDLTDGELLPMRGGPHDGKCAPVNFIFPFLGGGMPSAALRFGDDWYTLNEKERCWNYAKVVEKGKKRKP